MAPIMASFELARAKSRMDRDPTFRAWHSIKMVAYLAPYIDIGKSQPEIK